MAMHQKHARHARFCAVQCVYYLAIIGNMISLHITDEQAQRFAEVYKEEYGEDMTILEARAAIQDVLPLIDLMYFRPLPKKKGEEPQKKVSA